MSTQRKKKSSSSTSGAKGPGYHRPVLLREVLTALQPAPGKVFFDGTFGGGGHARALLEAGAAVVGCDRDPDVLGEARRLFGDYGERFAFLQAEFRTVHERLAELRLGPFDGVLLDLGVSWHQLETAERGFSFQREGPLDMRMNPQSGPTAADLLATASEEQLADWFWRLGEEPAARRLAARIVEQRAKRPLRTTGELSALVNSVVPRRGPRHPATKVFQALRIVVNHELEELTEAMANLRTLVRLGGRMAIITFHSLEDRLVKNYFRDLSREWDDRPEWPEPRPNSLFAFRLVNTRAIAPGEEEIRENARARSAKLRVIERIRYES
ncbi:MAG: 16S rRNA (cytosine(1402)-N(4))-methyltransferase RsmH [Verrucomicrobia bacterium]|nr:16S rRNA (cytosine(1402)-N(4))-methyltransferase RsmH [Verrucomicrobiota bacterium]